MFNRTLLFLLFVAAILLVMLVLLGKVAACTLPDPQTRLDQPAASASHLQIPYGVCNL